MKNHKASPTLWRVDVYLQECYANLVSKEIDQLKDDHIKVSGSKYFITLLIDKIEAFKKTGLSINELCREYIRMKNNEEKRVKELTKS